MLTIRNIACCISVPCHRQVEEVKARDGKAIIFLNTSENTNGATKNRGQPEANILKNILCVGLLRSFLTNFCYLRRLKRYIRGPCTPIFHKSRIKLEHCENQRPRPKCIVNRVSVVSSFFVQKREF